MHLIDSAIRWVSQVHKARPVAARNPRVGSAPGVALDPDILGPCASGSNGIDGSLVQVSDELIPHPVKLVVGVEDDEPVVLETCSDGGPPRAKARHIRDYFTVVAAVVMRVDDCIQASVFPR